MPLSQYLKSKLLALEFGDTSYSPPATFYVGLILQAATLTSGLTAGSSYTTLSVSSLSYAIASGDIIALGSGANVQVVQASAAASAGATSISVTSFVANAAYASGTPLIRCDAYATAQEPTGNAYARVSYTNNTTNWPAPAAVTLGYQSENGAAITFPAATGTWGLVAGFVLGDNATPGSGNCHAFGMLTTPQTIVNGDTASFAVDALTAALIA